MLISKNHLFSHTHKNNIISRIQGAKSSTASCPSSGIPQLREGSRSPALWTWQQWHKEKMWQLFSPLRGWPTAHQHPDKIVNSCKSLTLNFRVTLKEHIGYVYENGEPVSWGYQRHISRRTSFAERAIELNWMAVTRGDMGDGVHLTIQDSYSLAMGFSPIVSSMILRGVKKKKKIIQYCQKKIKLNFFFTPELDKTKKPYPRGFNCFFQHLKGFIEGFW